MKLKINKRWKWLIFNPLFGWKFITHYPKKGYAGMYFPIKGIATSGEYIFDFSLKKSGLYKRVGDDWVRVK